MNHGRGSHRKGQFGGHTWACNAWLDAVDKLSVIRQVADAAIACCNCGLKNVDLSVVEILLNRHQHSRKLQDDMYIRNIHRNMRNFNYLVVVKYRGVHPPHRQEATLSLIHI